VVYIPYNETHYVNLNQLLLKEGYAEAKDYPNEFNPDDWIGSLEYVAMLPSPEPTLAPLAPTPTLMLSPSPVYTSLPSPTSAPGFEFWFLAIIGVLVVMYLIKRDHF
jgi:hypothetical protein